MSDELSDPDPTYTATEVDAAVRALGAPERVAHAQEVVTHAAPALQRILGEALQAGGWFGSAHDAEVGRAAGEPDPEERLRAVGSLVAEQTRLGMFVGVAVGFELAHELRRQREHTDSPSEREGVLSEASPPSEAPASNEASAPKTSAPNETPTERL